VIYSCSGELGFTRDWELYDAYFSLAGKYFRPGVTVYSEPASTFSSFMSPHGFRYENLNERNMPNKFAQHCDIIRVSIPHWLAGAVAALASLLAYFRATRRRPAAPGHLCRSCGYDIRASNSRCPECGTAIPSHAEAAT
jgi:predicted Zn-ribbon and HTH transcriptional regulator